MKLVKNVSQVHTDIYKLSIMINRILTLYVAATPENKFPEVTVYKRKYGSKVYNIVFKNDRQQLATVLHPKDDVWFTVSNMCKNWMHYTDIAEV
jgi:hypothetical protein